MSQARLTIREATAADNDALVELADRCPIEGPISLCMERRPEFLALNRIAGLGSWVLVAEVDDGIAGCLALAARQAHLNGAPCQVGYAMDFKVAPEHRRRAARQLGVADHLVRALRDLCAERLGEHAIVQLAIMAGNRPVEARIPGPRGMPPFDHFATLVAYSIPALLPVLPPRARIRVDVAEPEDVAEMIALWRRSSAPLQFAEVQTEQSFEAFVRTAPGLALDDYLLARDDRTDELLGFVGFWDQSPIRQLRIVRYSRRLDLLRRLFNGAGVVTRGPRLPSAGGFLRALTAVHLCAPLDRPAVLRALVVHAINDQRERYAILNLALDVRDPRASALRGLFAQSTRLGVYSTSPQPIDPDELRLADRLLHCELALT